MKQPSVLRNGSSAFTSNIQPKIVLQVPHLRDSFKGTEHPFDTSQYNFSSLRAEEYGFVPFTLL